MDILKDKEFKVFDINALKVHKAYGIFLSNNLIYHGILYKVDYFEIHFAIAKEGKIEYYTISVNDIINKTYTIKEMGIK